MGTVIAVISGKGGVGKTTTTANLGLGLALNGKKCAIVDFDIGQRNLDMILGLENRIVYDVVDVMEGNCNLAQAIIKDKRTQNLHFLPASQTKDKNVLNKALQYQSHNQHYQLLQNLKLQQYFFSLKQDHYFELIQIFSTL